MKKIIFALSVLLSVLYTASCSKEQIENIDATPSCNLKFDFTVADFGSKAAIKSSWTNGDKIVLFFNNKPADGYLTLTYDGSKWSASPSGGIESSIAAIGNGSFDAVYCADSNGSVTEVVAGTQWMVGGEDSYFMSQENGSYTLSGTTVSFNISLALGYDKYIEIFIPGATSGDILHVHGTTLSDTKAYTAGLLAASCAQYKTTNYTFVPKSGSINGNIKGYAHTKDEQKGAMFYAICKGGTDNAFTFCLKHDSKDWYYSVTGKTLAGGKSIKLPNVSSWTEDAAKCVLYKDGHFVINQYLSDIQALEKKYGVQKYTYVLPDGTDYSSTDNIPWKPQRKAILYVEVFYDFTPNNMENWFNGAGELISFNGKGLIMTNVTKLKNTFATCAKMTTCDVSSWRIGTSCSNMEGTFIECTSLSELDLSNWGCTNVQTLRQTFKNCSALKAADLSSWNTNLKSSNALSETFNGCTSIATIDLGNVLLRSEVTTCNACFQNCSNLTTIWVSPDMNWQQSGMTANNNKNIFAGCAKLEGGQGSKYDSSKAKDNTFAKIDGGTSDRGYFTNRTTRQN